MQTHQKPITPLMARIHQAIHSQGGQMTFHDYMQMALYEPGLGYYQQHETILGAQGDFVTAPELTSLFGKTLSLQIGLIAQDLSDDYTLMEIGPGRGKLAYDLLQGLNEQNRPPKQTLLVETSESLITQQKQTLCDIQSTKINWCSIPKEPFEGIIIANELIDALPVHRVRLSPQPKEWYVTLDEQQNLAWKLGPLSSSELKNAVENILQQINEPLPENYDTEINLNQEKILNELSECLTTGVVIFIDYGFDSKQYYHHDRKTGTLMTHQAHKSHTNPLKSPGKVDITAHVDFSKLAFDAIKSGFSLLGYTSQAHFLLSCGILDELQRDHNLQKAHNVQTLVAPHEMGELFKVIAFGKNYEKNVKGFQLKDFSHYL